MPISRSRYKQDAYTQAYSLRKRGFTYTEIAKICAVSRGTVSNWFRAEPFSQAITTQNKRRAAADNRVRIGLVNKARKSERKAHQVAVLKGADTEYRHYRHSPLFIAGLMFYAAAGDQASERPIRLSGKQPHLHRLFIHFLIDFLGVERKAVRCTLLLYPEHDEVAALKHWSKQTGLSVGQFRRSQRVKSRSQALPLHFGVGNTIIASTLLKQKLMHWQALAFKELKN